MRYHLAHENGDHLKRRSGVGPGRSPPSMGRPTSTCRRPRGRIGNPSNPGRPNRGRSRILAQPENDQRSSAGDPQRRGGSDRAGAGARPLTVLDAHALVAFLADETAAGAVEAILRDSKDEAAIGAANIAEAIDVLVRVHGHPLDAVDERVGWLLVSPLTVIDADERIGRLAGRLRATHYDRKERPISLGDCLCLATALATGHRIATADSALAAVAHAEGVELIGLPDSGGRLPG
jgi:PIN domain nuclease of toxin-antitoxin system